MLVQDFIIKWVAVLNGLQFQTPEAITAVETIRASHYLRAMAIWGVYGVMEWLGIVSRKDAEAQSKDTKIFFPIFVVVTFRSYV